MKRSTERFRGFFDWTCFNGFKGFSLFFFSTGKAFKGSIIGGVFQFIERNEVNGFQKHIIALIHSRVIGVKIAEIPLSEIKALMRKHWARGRQNL